MNTRKILTAFVFMMLLVSLSAVAYAEEGKPEGDPYGDQITNARYACQAEHTFDRMEAVMDHLGDNSYDTADLEDIYDEANDFYADTEDFYTKIGTGQARSTMVGYVNDFKQRVHDLLENDPEAMQGLREALGEKEKPSCPVADDLKTQRAQNFFDVFTSRLSNFLEKFTERSGEECSGAEDVLAEIEGLEEGIAACTEDGYDHDCLKELTDEAHELTKEFKDASKECLGDRAGKVQEKMQERRGAHKTVGAADRLDDIMSELETLGYDISELSEIAAEVEANVADAQEAYESGKEAHDNAKVAHEEGDDEAAESYKAEAQEYFDEAKDALEATREGLEDFAEALEALGIEMPLKLQERLDKIEETVEEVEEAVDDAEDDDDDDEDDVSGSSEGEAVPLEE